MALFQKGQSGNPRGKPRGSGHAQKLREAIEQDLPDIVQSVVNAAKSGDMQAAKLLLDRAVPAMKPIQEGVKVTGLNKGTLTEKGDAIIRAMGRGALSPSDAQSMLSGLASQARISEIDELEERIKVLEEKQP